MSAAFDNLAGELDPTLLPVNTSVGGWSSKSNLLRHILPLQHATMLLTQDSYNLATSIPCPYLHATILRLGTWRSVQSRQTTQRSFLVTTGLNLWKGTASLQLTA